MSLTSVWQHDNFSISKRSENYKQQTWGHFLDPTNVIIGINLKKWVKQYF